MSDRPESEVRIESLRDGGFIIFKGFSSPHSFNPPAKACSSLAEVLAYVAGLLTEPTTPNPTPANGEADA